MPGVREVIQIAALVTLVQLQAAMNVHITWRVVYVLLMLVPCVNVLVLLSVASQATSVLTQAGLKVGLIGTSDDQVVRVLSPNRCSACGCILATGAAGPCPECGATAVTAP